MRAWTPRVNRCLLAALVAGLVPFTAPAWGGVINEYVKLRARDGSSGDWFGYSIAIDNGVIAVGRVLDGENGSHTGSVYLFDAITGAQSAKLLAGNGCGGAWFGSSIAIDGGVVAIGATYDCENGRNSGSAYLFDASTGEQIVKLLASDGAEGHNFGQSIAIDNGVVAIGAHGNDDNGFYSGAAYLFNASTGEQLFKLIPSDGAEGDAFGWSIAIDNGVVAVGAMQDADNGPNSGSAYLFDASTGAQIAKLLADDGASPDLFGFSIAIDNGVVAVGARYALSEDRTISGSAYLFDATTGVQFAKLSPGDAAAFDRFGSSIAIDRGIVVVGATGDDENGSNSGSAYLFDASTGAQIAKLLPSDGAEFDYFSWSIAIDSGIVAVGARNDDSAYAFDVGNGGSCIRDPEWLCDGDVDGDGQVNPVDSGLVQASFGSTDEQDVCNYDLDCDGRINPVDSGIVQSLFGTCEAPRNVCP